MPQINCQQEARKISGWLTELRRKFHQIPEIMYEEIETSKHIRKVLDQLNINWISPANETGTLALLGKENAPCVALRADIDALPVNEEIDCEYKSIFPGKMHACGHDGHIAMLLGAAKILKENEKYLNGRIKLIFQPAEEGGAGAKRMLEQGVLENPKVDRIYALHLWPDFVTGKIAGNYGPVLAADHHFKVQINGKGGHGAYPHKCIDPIVCAAECITAIQKLVSRETDPVTPAVVSVGTINAGKTANVIPPTATFSGTIRCLSLDGLKTIKHRFTEIIKSIVKANRCSCEITSPLPDFPATVNNKEAWQTAAKAASKIIGPGNVETFHPTMGAEDFAFFLQQINGCMAFVGARDPKAKDWYGLHHPCYKIDENALQIGTAWLTEVALATFDEMHCNDEKG
jgi:IAA-amino acid hydrolase